MPRVTVVVPATKDAPTLGRCLDAIGGQADEVLVVDEPRSLSAAAARNAGARAASGDVVMFVDSDVLIEPDAVARVVAAFSSDPQLTAVFGAYDDDPGHPSTVSRFRNLLHHHVHASSAGPATTFWSGLGAIRRDALLAVGGFDERSYPTPSVEDIELGGRLVAAGAVIRLDPAIRGKHLKRWTLRKMLVTDFDRRALPWLGVLLRERRSSTALNLGWRHRSSAAAVVLGLACASGRRRRPALAALGSLLALNHRFYALLWRRGGPRLVVAGIGLHALHHATAAAAVPIGLLLHLGRMKRDAQTSAERAGSARSSPPEPALKREDSAPAGAL